MRCEPHNVMEAIQLGSLGAALQMAYGAIVAVGYTHSQLVKEHGLTYPTLRNIREGQVSRASAPEAYLQTFIRLLNTTYAQRLAKGGEGATEILRLMRNILLLRYGIDPAL